MPKSDTWDKYLRFVTFSCLEILHLVHHTHLHTLVVTNSTAAYTRFSKDIKNAKQYWSSVHQYSPLYITLFVNVSKCVKYILFRSRNAVVKRFLPYQHNATILESNRPTNSANKFAVCNIETLFTKARHHVRYNNSHPLTHTRHKSVSYTHLTLPTKRIV